MLGRQLKFRLMLRERVPVYALKFFKQQKRLKNMSDISKISDSVRTLVVTAKRFRGFSFSTEAENPLLDLVSLVTFRQLLGENRPPLIGFIGCTGSGKSTLFNSLAGRSISATGWRVHNTRGPVLFAPATMLNRLKELEFKYGPLLLPLLKRVNYSDKKNALSISEIKKTGLPGDVHILTNRENENSTDSLQAGGDYVLIDLPDINSSPALEEHLIALDIMPWLDIVIFMVDDETIYHRVYAQPVQLANDLNQVRFCVMAYRGKDRIDMNHPDLQQVMTFFGVNEIHVLPDLKKKELYYDDPAFLALKNKVAASRGASSLKPLIKRISRLARAVCDENRLRKQALEALEKNIFQIAQETLEKDASISLQKILSADTLHRLNHLGLKRFSVSNLLYFFKSIVTKGSLKRSFRLSFGNQRDEIISRMLHFDREKLVDAVTIRLVDHGERISLAIRRNPDLDFIQNKAPAFNPLDAEAINTIPASVEPGSLETDLQAIIDEFESRCRDLLASDSVSAIIKNDPIVTFFLFVMLVADAVVIPGFGSWLLVPTAFKYLPLGQFEAAKKRFQRSVQEVVQKQLMLAAKQLRDIRSGFVLENSDPLWQALNICGRYDGK